MHSGKNKKMEVSSIRRDLAGERQVNLTRLAGDTGTDEGERRLQLIWQNFRIIECTKANAYVLGTDHPDFCEGRDAAAGNSAELFESELFPAGNAGLKLERLSTIHSHYFGGGFERVVGKKLRQFVSERFVYDEKTGKVVAQAKVLTALRKIEARELIQDEKQYVKRLKVQMEKRSEGEIPSQKLPVGMAPSEAIFDPDKRPRYASTKMTPDECEERAGGSFGGKGMGKGPPGGPMPMMGGPMMGGPMGMGGPMASAASSAPHAARGGAEAAGPQARRRPGGRCSPRSEAQLYAPPGACARPAAARLDFA
eukprot:CAMPEP_0179238428 /NCGR_PEP_ID=MMETSP0797-20121207/14943_1 /TAXON_ID=47934 /ORGANISM="Dinophysis acuminata, Strain DAEP01" /LENGTH=309 /DNA_ID=CAMNT_0020945725 /DNA_START=60 /DNA_END=987 /DNA_ORIENTATION=-